MPILGEAPTPHYFQAARNGQCLDVIGTGAVLGRQNAWETLESVVFSAGPQHRQPVKKRVSIARKSLANPSGEQTVGANGHLTPGARASRGQPDQRVQPS
jgi:hypothetical protein